jgi:hypothetical protein
MPLDGFNQRPTPKWCGSGSLRPDREAASESHDSNGILWATERQGGAVAVRLRLARLVGGGLDLREQVLVDSVWRWTHRGVQIEDGEVVELARALEVAAQ